MSAVRYPVIELRQYTLRPGQRDVLIDLFDRELVEPQEAEGMAVVGQFRDLDDPDRFVWIRGFGDMASRARALAAFYGGPAWKAHRAEANATMIDSDNVLLLRPVSAQSGFPAPAAARFPVGATVAGPSRILVTLYLRQAGNSGAAQQLRLAPTARSLLR
jgi:NIPSNAP